MARIITRVHRPKRAARKRKAVAIETAIVHAGKRGDFLVKSRETPAIATSISRKRARLQRAEQAAEPEPDDDDPSALRAWLERAKWGRGPAR